MWVSIFSIQGGVAGCLRNRILILLAGAEFTWWKLGDEPEPSCSCLWELRNFGPFVVGNGENYINLILEYKLND
jgi:hypothetical protein